MQLALLQEDALVERVSEGGPVPSLLKHYSSLEVLVVLQQ